jgi:CubicO group peptidase (beta-lactamase class C family)
MRQKLLIFSFLFASFQNISAQRSNYIFTRTDTINTINNFIYQVMADWKVPACAITIVKDGKPYHSSAFGQRNIAKNLPATVNTLFGIASCTKSFTAAALAILADEGKLDWDKPVKTYMPDFQLYDQEATNKITARDLLSHRTGLPNHDDMWVAANADRKTLFENLKYLKPTHPLYTHYQYNNLMYMAAGVLV